MTNEAVQHLFDSHGNWIAFRRGKFVFDTAGNWIGWLPWDDADVFDVEGHYVGTIHGEDRLYRHVFHPYRGYPRSPDYPGYAGHPEDPGFAGYAPLPPDMTDVALTSVEK